MKQSFFLLLCFVSSVALASEDKGGSTPAAEESKVNTSKPVTYIAAIVRRGDNWQQDSIRAFELQEKHLNFLGQLRKDEKLIASGPLTTSPDARGLYIFNVATIAEAEKLVAQDESIQAGWIKMDFHVWAARDYDVNTKEESAALLKVDEGFRMSGLGWTVVVFVVVIITLVIRTFRGVANA